MITPDDLAAEDGLGLAARIARRELSVREAVDAAIDTIERLNPHLNAVVDERFVAARAEADRMDRERPEAPGPLWGVPFLLKDVNLYSSALPTRFASRFFAGATPRGDSTLVRRWREAGLVILGTTNTPEFAADFTTEPLAYGPCRNPWSLGATVGGSSGGAAAAVSAGMVPLAHGTDLGGSIRIPAACCGVFGFKPSVGLNPLGPWWEEIAGGLDADHVLTRTVRDSAAALDLTAGPDAGTRLGRRPPPGGFLAALDAPLAPLRIGVTVEDAFGRRASAAQVAAVEHVAELIEAMGRRVEPYGYPPEAGGGAWFDALWTPDVLHLVRERAKEIGREPRRDELEPMTWALLELAEDLSALDHLRARLAMTAAAQAIGRSMEGLDLVLSPALSEDPPLLGLLTFEACGRDLGRWIERGYGFAPFATPANLAGQPAAVLPVTVSDRGLPVAVQFAGRPGDDALVLHMARNVEAAVGWQGLARSERWMREEGQTDEPMTSVE
ncbi:amidase [Rubellimicrobium roseum]|uniref:Amidase n=1 Tax=Rubellimicrobium roseum TaxID=687525 RepID=A0A5C4N7R5_9RHOB|nr:amidase [Rubellimicrobium roseum]TNC59363.1 amidase [Rubellimicrobium roseum]